MSGLEFTEGQHVFIQGLYEGVIESSGENFVRVSPLEGLLKGDEGKTFTYSPTLIKINRTV